MLQVVRSSLLSAGESQSQQISLSKEHRYCKAAEGEGDGGWGVVVGGAISATPDRHTASDLYGNLCKLKAAFLVIILPPFAPRQSMKSVWSSAGWPNEYSREEVKKFQLGWK